MADAAAEKSRSDLCLSSDSCSHNPWVLVLCWIPTPWSHAGAADKWSVLEESSFFRIQGVFPDIWRREVLLTDFSKTTVSHLWIQGSIWQKTPFRSQVRNEDLLIYLAWSQYNTARKPKGKTPAIFEIEIPKELWKQCWECLPYSTPFLLLQIISSSDPALIWTFKWSFS